ncbi:MAG: hypothetical protein B6U69_04200 [Thermofilum sp. ex4484_15]|nr:MAG: hypothetical protein B6U69_04200 [Thermofilum sp. ex4484_15]
MDRRILIALMAIAILLTVPHTALSEQKRVKVKVHVPEVVVIIVKPESYSISVSEDDFINHRMVYSDSGQLTVGTNHEGTLVIGSSASGNVKVIRHMYINVNNKDFPVNSWKDEVSGPGETSYTIKFGLKAEWDLPKFEGVITVVITVIPS